MKWVIRGVLGVFALAVALVGAVFLLPADRLAKIATEQLAAATGRSVEIHGDVSLSLWPVLGVSANDLEVGNAEWAREGQMLQAANAAIGVDAMALLKGEIRITNVEARSPTIRLEKRLDGRASWVFSDASGGGDGSGSGGGARIETQTTPQQPARPVTIAKVNISDATLIYDAEGSDIVSLSGVDIALDWPDPSGPAQIAAAVRPAGKAVQIDMVADAFADFIAGDVSPLRLSVKAGSGNILLDGRASTSGEVAGDVSLSAANTDAFLRDLGLPPVGLPPKLGQSLALTTDLTLTPDRQLALSNLRLDLGGNLITGAADMGLNGVPQINAQLDAGELDVSPAFQGESAERGSGSDGSSGNKSGSSAKSTDGWSTDTIDASALASFKGEIALSAQSIDLGTFQLGATQTVLRNENSRMVFELRDVAAYGGQITGEFVANNRSGLSVGGNMAIKGIQMQPLLADAIDFDRLTGRGDMQVSFLGSGQSVDAIMRSLSGNGGLNIGRGTVEGIDLDRLLRGEGRGGTTVFDDLSASWTISNGVLSNRDLLLQLKNYRATGDGVVGIGTRSIDYRVTPVALRANSGKGLAIPVLFKGPWSDISIQPDIEAAVDLELDAKKKELERSAKDKLSKELKLDKKDGQSTEDAIKDRLLRKLFD